MQIREAVVLLNIFYCIASECIDGVDNILSADSYGNKNLPVKVRNVKILVYDIDGQPSCHKNKVNVVLPGYFHIISGEVEVPKNYDLFASNVVRATVKFGSTDICDNGKSGMLIVPARFCHFDIATVIPENICHLLQKKGLHTLKELEEKLKFNSTFQLPPSPSFLGITLLDLLKGEYRIKVALDVDDEKIMEFAMPSGFKAIKIGLDDDDE
ncbi:unnamed protein product [Cylicocyclus nassatus]|uniref:Uncharacterized protein n=1 Tax=Cylicocyclus nassatus TaxID=53992 RepID=A0AA36HAN8_CYLNA|nr:unnamed protein product [Cylicocyclus nassatus]